MGKGEVKDAEGATERALSFLKERYPFRSIVARPVRAVREDDVWSVDIDVGIIKVMVANFKIDSKTGKIIQYAIPPL